MKSGRGWSWVVAWWLGWGMIALSSGSPLAALELVVDPLHPMVRPGLLHRFRLHLGTESKSYSEADAARERGVDAEAQEEAQREAESHPLVYRIVAGQDSLTQGQFAALTRRDLRRGVTVNWVAPDSWSDQPLVVEASWLRPSRPLHLRQSLHDLPRLSQRLSDLVDRIDREAAQDPLPRLWIEQAGLELRGPVDLFGAQGLMARADWLSAWLRGERLVRQSEEAYVAHSDGSVQPFRWHHSQLPEITGTILWCDDGTGDSEFNKSRWSSLDQTLLQSLTAAGWQVIEIYPAGDRAWRGIAVQRLHRLLNQWLEEGRIAASSPVLGWGRGSGAAGLLALAQIEPHRLRALVLDGPRWAAEPALVIEGGDAESVRWRSLQRDLRRRSGHLRDLPMFLRGRLDDDLAWLNEHRLRPCAAADLRRPDWWSALTTLPAPPSLLTEYRLFADDQVVGPFYVERVLDPLLGGRIIQSDDGRSMRVEGLQGVRWREGQERPGVALESPVGPENNQARQTVDGYATAPFVVIVGSGEHAASQARNRRLAQSFVSAWARHAHGRPPWVMDHDFDEERWQGFNWVLIGDPRSNAITAGLLQRSAPWPVQWDHRQVTIAGNTLLRTADYGLALAVRDPLRAAQVNVVLDGNARLWADRGLPLQHLGAMVWRLPDGPLRFRRPTSP